MSPDSHNRSSISSNEISIHTAHTASPSPVESSTHSSQAPTITAPPYPSTPANSPKSSIDSYVRVYLGPIPKPQDFGYPKAEVYCCCFLPLASFFKKWRARRAALKERRRNQAEQKGEDWKLRNRGTVGLPRYESVVMGIVPVNGQPTETLSRNEDGDGPPGYEGLQQKRVVLERHDLLRNSNNEEIVNPPEYEVSQRGSLTIERLPNRRAEEEENNSTKEKSENIVLAATMDVATRRVQL